MIPNDRVLPALLRRDFGLFLRFANRELQGDDPLVPGHDECRRDRNPATRQKGGACDGLAHDMEEHQSGE